MDQPQAIYTYKASAPCAPLEMANALRALSMDAVERAQSGHPGMPMGMADVAMVLFTRFLTFDPTHPHWPDRDRFVLSAGHGSMLLYALLHLTGYQGVTIDELKRLRQLGSLTPGHPEYGHTPGVETTTGPLGQGLATAVGMALAERLLAERHGRRLVDHWTYVICGDGCLMEGVSQEAISLAGHLGLGRLILLWDDNRISIDGPTSLATSEDQAMRFVASGWQTIAVDGHDPDAVAAAITLARSDPRPSLIACRTVIGKGAPTKAGTEKAHGSPLGEAEIKGAREALSWSPPPFEIPPAVAEAWKAVGRKGASLRRAWEERRGAIPPMRRAAFDREQRGLFPDGWEEALRRLKAKLVGEKPAIASRKASELVLEILAAEIPQLIGGSADLTHSNLTLTRAMKPVTPTDFTGSYVHYGVREHGMAAAMNGIALHGGLIPYGGTFLVFSDYCRPAIRLAALMGTGAIYVMTHDSIGLGEDGPTHQPVEHLAVLRAIPGLLVFRPADAVETLECWELALRHRDRPSLLALSRQSLPTLRTAAGPNLSAEGGYVLRPTEGPRDLTILATGSEVAIAVEAALTLDANGIAAAVVSLPSFELFAAQDQARQDEVMGTAPRIAIEAGSPMSWYRFGLRDADIIGMRSFGASAPAPDLYRHFKITADAIVDRAQHLVARRVAA